MLFSVKSLFTLRRYDIGDIKESTMHQPRQAFGSGGGYSVDRWALSIQNYHTLCELYSDKPMLP